MELDPRRAVLLLQGVVVDTSSFDGKPSAITNHPSWRLLSEAGNIFQEVSAFANENDRESSVTRQALSSAIRAEVDNHLRDVASMELEVAKSRARTNRTATTGTNEVELTDQVWTLRRICAWAASNIRRLRALQQLVQGCRSLHGTHILSAVWSFSRHGEPDVQDLAQTILAIVSVPLLSACQSWIRGADGLSGGRESDDFFVSLSPPTPHAGVLASTVGAGPGVPNQWTAFTLNESRVPALLPASLASDIFKCGKTLRFIREVCNDEEWVTALGAKVAAGSQPLTRGHGPVDCVAGLAALESEVQVVLPIANMRLLWLLKERFSLLSHLAAIHRYVLLTQGDFVSSFVQAVGPELRKPGPTVSSSKHVLDGILEGAMRSSNAHLDDRAVLDRVCVRFLTPSPRDSGWDVFVLSYDVPASSECGPVSCVVDVHAKQLLTEAFTFLFQMRRAEHEITSAWIEQAAVQHKLRRVQQKLGRGSGWSGQDATVAGVMHRCHLARTDMTSWLSAALAYVQYDVLAPAWMHLHECVEKAVDMDGAILAYRGYLDAISQGLFLRQQQQQHQQQQADVRSALTRVLGCILDFADSQRRFASALSRAADADAREADNGGGHGGWGSDQGAASASAAAAEAARWDQPLVAAVDRYRAAVSYLFELMNAAPPPPPPSTASSSSSASVVAIADRLASFLTRYDFYAFNATVSGGGGASGAASR